MTAAPVSQSYGEGLDPGALLLELSAATVDAPDAAALAERNWRQSGNVLWCLPLGLALWQSKQYDKAWQALQQAATAAANDPNYHVLAGMVARRLPGHDQAAVRAYQHAICLDPQRHDIYYNLANLLQESRPQPALRGYQLSLALNNQAAATWHNYARLLTDEDRPDLAIGALQTSLRLDPFEADVWCNLGLAWYQLEDFDRALACLYHAISLDKQLAAGYINIGNALISKLEPQEALAYLQRGVELDSSSANSLWNLSLAYLLLGDYKRGWDYYEARFSTAQFDQISVPTTGPAPRTLEECPKVGEPALVVWCEQGIGDAIQFCRYLPLLEVAGVPFELQARASLIPLLRDWMRLGERVKPYTNRTDQADPRPQLALLSLPRLFGTELHTIPAVTPYLTPPAPPPTQLRVPPPPGGLAVGLVWATNPENKAMYRHKTMPLDLLLPRLLDLVDLDLIDLHSLQVGADAEPFAQHTRPGRVFDWNGSLNDFGETAHVVQQLDLVISVDTAVAHLAGALDRPTWLLLPQNADFRWLRERSDSPWYSSMRVFRQTTRGDWQGVVEQVQAALDELFLLDLEALAAAKLAR